MKNKGLLLIFTGMIILLYSTVGVTAEQGQLTTVGVGVIYEGQDQFNQKLKTAILEELENVLGANYNFNFQIAEGNNVVQIKQQLKQMSNNQQLDIIITAGVLGSHLALEKNKFNKAVIAPYVLDNRFLKSKFKQQASGIENFNLITVKQFLNRDLAVFKKVTGEKKISFIMEKEHYQLLFKEQPQLAQAILGADNELITIASNDGVADIIDKLKGVEVVYLSPLLKLDDSKLLALKKELLNQEIPVVTTIIDQSKEINNIMAAYSHHEEVKRRARTTAINLEALLLGEKLKEQPIYITKSKGGQKKIVVDLTVAKTLGQLPDWSLLKEVQVINDFRQQGQEISLEQALKLAVTNNLDLKAQQQEQEVAHSKAEQATNKFKPVIDLNTSYSWVRDDIAANSMGQVKEKTWSGELVLTQVLFNERVNAQQDINNNLEQKSKFAVTEQKLNTILETKISYYNSLKVQADLELQQENLSLTKENLELAQTKYQIGAAGPMDTYRWESEVVMNSSAVTQVQQNFKNMKDNLKMLLDLDVEESIKLVDIKVNPVLEEIKNQFLFNTPWDLKQARAKLLKQGLDNSVELLKLDQLLAVKERERKMLKSDYYLPEIGLQAKYKKYFNEQGAGSNYDDSLDEWSVGIIASYPLYKGGNKSEKLKQVNTEIEQLKTKKRAAVAKLEKNIKTKVNNVNTQYLKWENAQQAVSAAVNNLELVRDSYSIGSVSVAHLLDAQRALISAKRKKSVTKYDFLIAVAEAKRALGEY